MRVIKQIVDHDTDLEINFYVLADGEFIIHAVQRSRYRNTFAEKEHEHPMKITEVPWNLYDVGLGDNDKSEWVFKRTNGNVEEMLVLTEVHRMKIAELSP